MDMQGKKKIEKKKKKGRLSPFLLYIYCQENFRWDTIKLLTASYKKSMRRTKLMSAVQLT